MKNKGDKAGFSAQRLDELIMLCHAYKQRAGCVSIEQMYKDVVRMPSSRFWCSPSRAATVVSGIKNGGKALCGMWPMRRKMYMEIYRRVCALEKVRPGARLIDLCRVVVESPAPEFYLTDGTAKVMLSRVHGNIGKEKRCKMIKDAIKARLLLC